MTIKLKRKKRNERRKKKMDGLQLLNPNKGTVEEIFALGSYVLLEGQVENFAKLIQAGIDSNYFNDNQKASLKGLLAELHQKHAYALRTF